MRDNKKLAEILNGKNFLKFLKDKDYENVDVNDLVEMIEIATECEGKNFKFLKSGAVKCLKKALYEEDIFYIEFKRYMIKNYDKLNKESVNKLLEWDRFLLSNIVYENEWYERSAFIISDIFFRNLDNSYNKKVIEIIEKYFNDVKRVFIEIFKKWVKNPPINIIYEMNGFDHLFLPFNYTINYFLCKGDPDITKIVIDNIKTLAKPYIMNGKQIGALSLDYGCLISSMNKNGIEFDEILLLTLLNFILSGSISDCKIATPILDRICTDYKYEKYWDKIKNYFNDCIKPNYYCFEVMDIFEI
jgi:hypothetical protein